MTWAHKIHVLKAMSIFSKYNPESLKFMGKEGKNILQWFAYCFDDYTGK